MVMFTWTALFVIVADALAVYSRDMSSNAQQNALGNVSAACAGFTNLLYTTLSTNTDSNVITSPLSLHMILSLLSNGASGFTLSELTSALHHGDAVILNNEFKALISHLNDIKYMELYAANAAYIQDGFELAVDFSSVCANVFQSSISRVDFNNNVRAAETVNAWVQKATNNKISDVMSSDDIDEETRVVLINAIYFKSKWLHPFDGKLTEKRKFHISKTEANLIPTMFRKSTYAYGEVSAWRARFIEIPYLNEDVAMVILLPNRDVELQTLEKAFNWETLVKAPRSIDEVELHLPRFRFEVTTNLKDALRKIGLNTMFEDNADFTRLSSIPLKVSKVVQKVFMEVNEEGSEAAAATAVVMRLRRMAVLSEQFMVDRPFMFAIEHKPSNVPLFLGSVRRIESPQEKDEL